MLEVDRDVRVQPHEPQRERAGLLQRVPDPVALAETGRDAEARRPDRLEPGRDERRGRREIPRVGQDQRVADLVQVGKARHFRRLRERSRVPFTRATTSPFTERPAGQIDGDDRPVRGDALRGLHREIIPAHEPGRRLARLDEQRDVLRERLGLVGREEREQRGERLVRAGRVRPGVIRGGDHARGRDGRDRVRDAGGRSEHGDGEIGARDVGERRAWRRGAQWRRAGAAATRAARQASARPGSSAARRASTRARRRACVSPLAKRDTVARSQGIVPNGPGGPGSGTGRSSMAKR